MAIANTEGLRTSINIETLRKTTARVASLKTASSIVPWEMRWSAFPQEAVYGTTGLYLKYRSAQECLMSHKDTLAAKVWYQAARRDFLNHIHDYPLNKRVYQSLQQSDMFSVEPRETLLEKSMRSLQRFKILLKKAGESAHRRVSV